MTGLRYLFLAALAATLCFPGCARRVVYDVPVSPAQPVALKQVDARQMDFADDQDPASLLLAIDHSLKYFEGSGRAQVFAIEGRLIGALQMTETLVALRDLFSSGLSAEERNKRIADEFLVYRAAGEKGDGAVLFTGYYEPLLEGSLTPTATHRHPLYKVPPDLVARRVTAHETQILRMENGGAVPYYSRREIDVNGVLRDKNLELIWVADPVELFSLHIQGSGKVRLEDGRMISVSYAQNNGRPFRSVTRNMLDNNRIARGDAGYRSFKNYLKTKNEQELFDILSHNERYIFFRFVDGEPLGSLGVPVTPDRSIATDPEYFPQGAPAFIRMRKPVFDEKGNITARVGFSRFVLNQDKGSAIKGPGRVDLFCGFGDQAQSTAGTIKEHGEMYFLLKR
ncbi:MAG: MltA domain-containing protein [Smithellaceae bacterium]